MNPVCPPDYTCTFTRLHPRVVNHTLGPWYQHTAGWVVAVIAILALACVAAYAVSLHHQIRYRRQIQREHDDQRKHDLAIEEQRTMQADAAKGDPEMLRLIRQRI
jgi:hypothetical protein